jgi:prepilin-type N-terminal cleavage/methylation domain-containing protein/prepilin-type processing-associated H-X9-DG protein
MKLHCEKGFGSDHHRQERGNAFTLVELLVVIAILAILAALLLPALTRARGKAQTVTCLNNVRQVELACLVYTDEFNDRLPYNLGENEINYFRKQNRYPNWSTPIMDWERHSDNTNSALLTEGGIGPYTGRAARLYKCPKDNFVSDIQSGVGWSARVRSLSMNAMVGDAGTFSQSGANVNNPGYRQFFKVTQVPKPSEIFTFVEEHPNSIGDGYFLNKPDTFLWLRLPASHHNGGVNLSFTDGHVEMHKWQSALTQPQVRPGVAYLPLKVWGADLGDFYWLMFRTTTESSPNNYDSEHDGTYAWK